MLTVTGQGGQIGIALANSLGLALNKRERHDLAGPCIACQSSDAFRLHTETGVAHCFSCHGKWSPFQLAETVLGDRVQAKNLMVELGIFQPETEANGQATNPDPIETVARQKGVLAESLRAFGAKTVNATKILLPGFGPDGKACTHFSISTKVGTQANKGLFAKDKPAGLFFPHFDGQVRLPQLGEVWHLVEGPKDAAALYQLGLLACGLNTCRLAAKFARLFAGVEAVLIPDRDRAGEDGAQFSAGVLRGVAKSVRIAVLPAEFKETKGDDVRDVLRQSGGRELVMQAISDAREPDYGSDDQADDQPERPACASVEVALPNGTTLKLEVSPKVGSKPQRVVCVKVGDKRHVDRIDVVSERSRTAFFKRLAEKTAVDRDILADAIDSPLFDLAEEADREADSAGSTTGEDTPNQATSIAEMAAGWDLWHTAAGDGYATIPVGEHREHWPIRSQTFRRYVAKVFYDEMGKVASSEAVGAAINLIEAQAAHDGEEHPVFVRVAENEGNFYIDLCDRDWRAVEVSPTGWRIVDEPPVRFRRSKGMLALPRPERGGSVSELRRFINVADEVWPLVVAWLVAALRPRGPFPVLALFATQGAGKSTAARMVRSLIDPNTAPLRAEPRQLEDLMISANASWTIALDNLSHLSSWLSDALCRLSTGGGMAKRELYTNLDEVIFDAVRPIILTSIVELAERSDLLDRCLPVTLPAIGEADRREEETLLADFEAARPRIFGALLDAVAGALAELPNVKLARLPRMADFAKWVTAAELALGWPRGAFMAAYDRNREAANELALEASPIASKLFELLAATDQWEGTAGELLNALEETFGNAPKRPDGWPKNPRGLSGHLRRLAPNLQSAGWSIDFGRSNDRGRRRTLLIRTAATVSRPEFASEPSGPSDIARIPEDYRGLAADGRSVAPDGLAPAPDGRQEVSDAQEGRPSNETDAKKPLPDGPDGSDAKSGICAAGRERGEL